jgi:hypothetical protein
VRDLVSNEVKRLVTEKGGELWSPFSERLGFWKENSGFLKGK